MEPREKRGSKAEQSELCRWKQSVESAPTPALPVSEVRVGPTVQDWELLES